MKTKLFEPLTLRGVTFRNRVFLSPMDQYSAEDGFPNFWHSVHYGSRAVGGVACLVQEATAVAPDGRITAGDLGIWDDAQVGALRRLVMFIKESGAVPALQLAHAGRKASTRVPWQGAGYIEPAMGGWEVVGPSPIPFDDKSPTPHALTEAEIHQIVDAFALAAKRAVTAGYQVVELHAAHGYLMHEFLSPLSNQRTDNYGGNLENRMRFVLEIATAVREAWPQNLPLFVRVSATDWMEGGWDLPQTIELCKRLKKIGVDFIDVSTGGLIPGAKIKTGPSYQVPFAEAVRKEVDMPVGAVGQITEARQAEQILVDRKADVVLLGRELLRDPQWVLHAAHALGEDIAWPKQYERAKPKNHS